MPNTPFVGQISAFGFNFAPMGWAQCNGQLIAVSSNDALFSLLGTIYGGDGRTTFGLPDLRGRLCLHQGTGPGLTPRPIGQKGGQERVTLLAQQMPSHDHMIMGSNVAADSDDPTGRVPATTEKLFYNDAASVGPPMESNMISNNGGSQSHNNIQPTLSINWCIALFGVYPSRS